MPAFLTSAAIEAGYTNGSAGLLLSMGGVVMVIARVSWGIRADRARFNRLSGVAAAMLAGVAAFALFAVGTQWSLAIGALVLFGIGWSWPGLLLLGVIERHPTDAGAATAVVQTSIRLGALLSPLAFGVLVDQWGYRPGWVGAGVLMALGALLMARAAPTPDAAAMSDPPATGLRDDHAT